MSQLVEREKAASPQVAHYTAEYQHALALTPAQPRWLAHLRDTALAQFERLGFPTTRLESWRFTSVAPIAERSFRLATDGADRIDRNLTSPLAGTSILAVSVNGRFVPQLSALDGLPKGVKLMGLEEVLASNP